MNFDEMSLEERVARWPKPWHRQGLEHERKLLRRQVALRFGAQTAERTAEELERIMDPEHLEEIGEWVVSCETGLEFLTRLGA